MTRRRVFSFLSVVAMAATALLWSTADPASAGFTTFSGPDMDQPVGMAAAPDGTLWFTNANGDSISEIDPTTGIVTDHTDANIDGPFAITVAPDGVVWFTNNENGRLGKIDGGVVTTYPGIEQIGDVEVAAVARALAEHAGVLALGGGAVLRPETQAALEGHRVVFLRVGLADAVQRVGLGAGRPLLLGNVRSKVKALLDERTPVYEAVATLTVDTDGRSAVEVADEIDRRLGAPDAGENA